MNSRYGSGMWIGISTVPITSSHKMAVVTVSRSSDLLSGVVGSAKKVGMITNEEVAANGNMRKRRSVVPDDIRG